MILSKSVLLPSDLVSLHVLFKSSLSFTLLVSKLYLIELTSNWLANQELK